jgi:hypothetical protein
LERPRGLNFRLPAAFEKDFEYGVMARRAGDLARICGLG